MVKQHKQKSNVNIPIKILTKEIA